MKNSSQIKKYALIGIIALIVFTITKISFQNYLQNSLVKYSSEGNLEQVKKLVEMGAVVVNKNNIGIQVDSFEDDDQVPLLKAVQMGHLNIVEYLLSKGADPHQRGNRYSPLHSAVIYNHFEIASKILTYGASPNTYTSHFKYSPLLEACLNKNYAMVELLLKHNADPNYINARNDTPLSISKVFNQPQIAQLLKQYGAIESTASKIKRKWASYQLGNEERK